MTDTQNTEQNTDVAGRAMRDLLGSLLPGGETWLTVSRDSQPHDTGADPKAAMRAFEIRTGIEWREAKTFGWRLARAQLRYSITAELVE